MNRPSWITDALGAGFILSPFGGHVALAGVLVVGWIRLFVFRSEPPL